MTTDIRQPIDVTALEGYFQRHLPSITVPLSVKQFSHGQSNPTYLVRSRNNQRYVLRKKPPGAELSSSSHQIEREYEVLNALQSSGVPVPQIFGLCQDASIIGTPFYIMEFLDGRIFEDPALPDLEAAERSLIWKEALKTLAKLHSVDLATIGLQKWSRPVPFYNRQISALGRVSVAQANAKSEENQQIVGQLPYYDQLVDFFSRANIQPKEQKSLVHGDFKIDNLVFHKTEPRVIGILDWELATEGHPLADLANLLSPMLLSAEDMTWLEEQTLTSELSASRGVFHPTVTRGLPSIAECLALYSEVSGWAVSDDEMRWAAAFNSFRTAVIMQGIAARLTIGQASSAKAKPLALQTLPYALIAHARVQQIMDRPQVQSRL